MKQLLQFLSLFLYCAVLVIVTLICLLVFLKLAKLAWELIAGVALSMLFWYLVLLPLFYLFPKAVALVFKGILRPAAILRSLVTPFIWLSGAFLIAAGYFENAFFKSCIRAAANWGISITGPVTFYTSLIFVIVIVHSAIFIKDARLALAEDEFWKIMNPYKEITAL